MTTRSHAPADEAQPGKHQPEACAHCGKPILRIAGTLAAWWVHDPGGHTMCDPQQAASSPRATPQTVDEEEAQANLDALVQLVDDTAAEERQTEASGCWCGHPKDRHWSGATSMTFPDGCHDCPGWNGAHAYGQELPWLPEGE